MNAKQYYLVQDLQNVGFCKYSGKALGVAIHPGTNNCLVFALEPRDKAIQRGRLLGKLDQLPDQLVRTIASGHCVTTESDYCYLVAWLYVDSDDDLTLYLDKDEYIAFPLPGDIVCQEADENEPIKTLVKEVTYAS